MTKKNSEDRASEVVSIVGPGMKVDGNCSTEGTLRVEGRVEGEVHAGKAVVVGEDGVVVGDIRTQDAVVAGEVEGTITAESRVEIQAGSRIRGDIRSRRVKLEEGGFVDGRITMGWKEGEDPGSPQESGSSARPGALSA